MIKKYKKRLQVLTILLGVVLFIAGTTYAIFKATASQTTQNDITTLNCFEVEYSDVTDAIALTNDFPISDAEGLERTPYTFKIKNKCTQLLNVQIGVETLTTSQIQPNLIKGVITNKGETPTNAKLLSNGILGTPVNGGTNYILLESSLAAFETKEFDLRLWFTESMTKEQGSGKIYQGKVTVISSPKTDTTIYGKLLADYFNSNGVKKTTDENGKDVYYYAGNITNNNLVFNNYCWKIIRTTETDGVKLLYNGEIRKEYKPIAKDKYSVTANTPTGTPFTFDETTKKWISGIAGVSNGENIIEFTVTETGNYVLNYEVSSQRGWDKGSFYKNGIELKTNISGVVSGTIELSGLTTSDVIKVVYKKDRVYDINDDAVRFSIVKPSENFTTNCNNTGSNVYIDLDGTVYNPNYNSPAYVGYMYGTVYAYSKKSGSSFGTYYYGRDVTWNGTTYTLSEEESGSIADMHSKLNNKHYTCLSTSTSCSTVYYIYSMSDATSDAYYMTLTNGKKIEDALDEMLNYNTTNSNIKDAIDNWYSTNMTNVTDYLENAIYCNNRHIKSLGGFNQNGGSVSSSFGLILEFNDYNTSNPRLTCQDKEDQFTLKVDSGGTLGYGNNALDYPVGLLTSGEFELVRDRSNTNYLNNGDYYWLLSPCHFYVYYASVLHEQDGYTTNNYRLSELLGARPAITLKQNILIAGGTGEIEDPYTVVLPN